MRLVAIRHGERQDEADDEWAASAGAPWDPPLSKKGKAQAVAAAKQLADFNIQWVVTSPFLRCMETTAMILDTLDMPWSRCTVDCRFSEVMHPGILARGSSIPEAEAGMTTAQWLWNGRSTMEQMQELLPPGACSQLHVQDADLPMPNETSAAAHDRYTMALHSLMADLEFGSQEAVAPDAQNEGTLLVVTHGEGVRAAVDKVVARAMVYEVLHCGYVTIEGRAPDPIKTEVAATAEIEGGIAVAETERPETSEPVDEPQPSGSVLASQDGGTLSEKMPQSGGLACSDATAGDQEGKGMEEGFRDPMDSRDEPTRSDHEPVSPAASASEVKLHYEWKLESAEGVSWLMEDADSDKGDTGIEEERGRVAEPGNHDRAEARGGSSPERASGEPGACDISSSQGNVTSSPSALA